MVSLFGHRWIPTWKIWSGRSPWDSLTAMSNTRPLATFVRAWMTCMLRKGQSSVKTAGQCKISRAAVKRCGAGPNPQQEAPLCTQAMPELEPAPDALLAHACRALCHAPP